MKYLLISSLLLSLGAGAATYSKNDGNTPPETFTSKSTKPIPSSGAKTIKTTKTFEQTTMQSDQSTDSGTGMNKKTDNSTLSGPSTQSDQGTIQAQEIEE